MKLKTAQDEECTLLNLFAVTPRVLADKLAPSVLMSSAEGKKKTLALWAKDGQWPHLSEQVADHVCDFLCPSVLSVVSGSWSKYAELRAQAKQTRADPSMSSEVALAHHAFVYEAAPSIELLIDGVLIGKIPFHLAVTWEVSGLVLSLRRGCVEKVRSGQSDCELELSCGGNVVWTHKVLAVNLPMIMHVSKPLAIL